MQNVQALSHPTAIETHARKASSRAAGSATGNSSVYSRTSIWGPSASGAPEEVEQMRERVRADHDVDPGRLLLDHALVLLRQAAGHDDPQIAGSASFSGFRCPRLP